ncbi:MAG TPA: hypothetical protein VJL81_17980 [Solirubrobacterales bacterium]|nr:hypothetical protein [Solirubrobacterales bacterium]
MSRELRYERLIQASPARVFDLFTSSAGQREFYGQDAPGWLVDSRCELRVGGAWEIDFGRSPGELYRHRHLFEAIERPRWLLFATTRTRPDGSRLTFNTEPATPSPKPRRSHSCLVRTGVRGCGARTPRRMRGRRYGTVTRHTIPRRPECWAPLAAGELPVWVASSFDGDLILVPAGRLDEAIDVLHHASHQFLRLRRVIRMRGD